MTDIRQIRLIAEELLVGLDTRTLDEDGQSPSFLEEQKGILQRALDESATPERYRVAVVGSFKVGKSSFVNALCGQRVTGFDINFGDSDVAEFTNSHGGVEEQPEHQGVLHVLGTIDDLILRRQVR